MTTRTYRINLVGEPDNTSHALSALDQLFADDALALLRERLERDNLTVERLVADTTEVVLYVTPSADATHALARDVDAVEAAPGSGESGGGTMSSERPPE